MDETLIAAEAVERHLDAARIGEGPVEDLAPIGDGHSNVTVAFRRGDRRLVLRRPPHGPLAPRTHDVVREARILRCLESSPVPVQVPLTVCEDPEVIGAPFYVTDFVEGVVPGAALPAELDRPAVRAGLGPLAADMLAAIHRVPLEGELAGLGGSGDYLDRQLDRFTRLWQRNRTRDVPAADALGHHVRALRPRDSARTLVHGDYRLGNLMFDAAGADRIVAVFDWEMATAGDPLADVGYLLAMWMEPEDPSGGVFDALALTKQPGFVSRADLVERYAQASWRGVDDLAWYRALALWKLLVFMEGNYARALAGGTTDPFVIAFGRQLEELAEWAWQSVRDGV